MAFEVASVKPTRIPRPPTYPMDNGNAYAPGGRLSVSLPLWVYISFAYKLPPNEQVRHTALAHLPAWVATELFAIDARAAGNPTKDQMRLMMQSLLADRFKLTVHFETREASVFALTLVKPGETGPRLRPHAEGPPCPDAFSMPTLSAPPDASGIFPENCEAAQSMSGKNGARLVGSRNATMPWLADAIYVYGFLSGEVDRPVVDKTGLQGRFDFTIESARGDNDVMVRSLPPGADVPVLSEQGSPFLTAVREQLGLKLTPAKSPIRMLVVDHIEKPSQN